MISYQLCMTWLNWSLKLHSSLRTIPHLILTHNTQDFVQLMLISFVWLYMFKCDVYAHVLADQTQNIFKCFICFWKWFYTFMFLHYSSPNANLKMKKGLWAAKAVVHTSIWLGKRKSYFLIEIYGTQKAKGSFSILKYQKFQAPISKWDVLFKKMIKYYVLYKSQMKSF